MEERVYQGYRYRRASANDPWQMVGPVQAPSRAGTVITDPYRQREEERKERASERDERSEGREVERLGLSADDNARATAKARIENAQQLRKEYAALPEVKAFKVAAQMASGALGTASNPQGDIALTYAFAKVMDPESVVRDQEANMVVNSQPWFQAAVQNIKKQFGMDGAGNFTPEARARLREEIVRAVASRKPLYDARRNELARVARANGLPPDEVIGDSDTAVFAPAFREYAVKNGDPSGAISSFLGEKVARPQPMQAAPTGSSQQSIPIPAEMQKAHADYLAKNWGKLDARDYAAFRVNLDRRYGFGSDPEGYATSAAQLNKDAAAGKLPSNQYIPAVKQELSGLDKFRNDIVANRAGAAVAAGLNAGGFGIPSLLARSETDALRAAYPVESFGGEVVGGIGGTGLASGLLRGAGQRLGNDAVAAILANPLTADVAYGAAFGATQADDPLYGAVGGAASAAAGNRIGRAVGQAFPSITGMGSAIRQADESVPSSQQLREMASVAYDAAESTGEQIGGPETFALNDRIAHLLRQEGRLSPKDRITEVQPKVREAYGLVSDYAGEPMTPKQVQTVRGVIGDAITTGDPAERRIARALMGEFDDWTDAAAPELASGLAEGRGIAQRYLQGDEIALARELADVRAGQFSNSGQGNALRTDFRQLDRQIAKGQQSFSPAVEEAVADVARGNTTSNILRNIGRFAPTGPMSSLPYLAAVGGGATAMDPLVALGGIGAAGLTYGARELGQRLTNRSAQVAENLAYGGPAYQAILNSLLESAAQRGGRGGALASGAIERALLDRAGY